jgi:carbon-monoxide dehydrogenase iron sulfur subunit
VAHKFIVCDPDKCVGCQICELSCSAVKEKSFSTLLSRVRLVRIEPVTMMSIACRACEEPACVARCPQKCLQRDDRTGMILVENAKCDGCAWCVEACQFGAIALNPATKKVVICDLCAGRSEPACVQYCPKDALELSTPEVVGQKLRKKVLDKLLKELVNA